MQVVDFTGLMQAVADTSWNIGGASARGLVRCICPSHMVGGSGGMLPQENFENYNPWNALSSILGTVFYRIRKVVKYVEDMIFS